MPFILPGFIFKSLTVTPASDTAGPCHSGRRKFCSLVSGCTRVALESSQAWALTDSLFTWATRARWLNRCNWISHLTIYNPLLRVWVFVATGLNDQKALDAGVKGRHWDVSWISRLRHSGLDIGLDAWLPCQRFAFHAHASVAWLWGSFRRGDPTSARRKRIGSALWRGTARIQKEKQFDVYAFRVPLVHDIASEQVISERTLEPQRIVEGTLKSESLCKYSLLQIVYASPQNRLHWYCWYLRNDLMNTNEGHDKDWIYKQGFPFKWWLPWCINSRRVISRVKVCKTGQSKRIHIVFLYLVQESSEAERLAEFVLIKLCISVYI